MKTLKQKCSKCSKTKNVLEIISYRTNFCKILVCISCQRQSYLKEQRCRLKTKRLILKGEILVKNCEVCGVKKEIIHHENYEDPSDVHFLCKKHHYLRHSKKGWLCSWEEFLDYAKS